MTFRLRMNVHSLCDLVVGSSMSCSTLVGHIQLCRMTENSTVCDESCEDRSRGCTKTKRHSRGRRGWGIIGYGRTLSKSLAGHGFRPRQVDQQIERKTDMPQIVSSVVCVIERNASASIKVKRIVCMLYFLGASHYVQRTWNKLGQRAVSALDTKTVIESATTHAAH